MKTLCFLISLIFITSTTAAGKSPAAGGSTLSVYSATKIARIFLPDSKDTLKIEYLKKGNKPETMILLHGFGASIYTWRNNIDELSKHFTVYAYNHLGAGKSNNPFPKYDLAAYTKQLLYFMENMKIKKAILVGNSMGCQIALAFAGQFPERIKGFVLIDPSGGNAVGDILRPSFMKIYSYADEDYSDLTGAFVKRILKDIFYDDNLVTEELAEKYRERWRRAEYRKAIRRTVMEFSCSNPQTLYRLRYAGNRIRTGKDYPHQCLILWGREDPWFLVGGLRDYTNELTGSETQIIEQAGHLPHEEQPAIVNRAIIRTFRSNKGFIKHEKIEFDRLITNLKSDDINIAAYSALTLGDTKKDEAIEPLIDLLDHEKSYVRVCAQIALRKLGENMVELFIRKFSDKKEPVQSRVALITALGNIWNKRAVMPLINAINDSDQSVRSAAIYSLGNIKDKRAVEPLIVAINDSSQSVRERAIEALGKLGDKRAFEPIIAVIDDENEYVRDEAVVALGKFKDQRLIEALVSRLKDDGVIEDVGLHAAEALAAIGEPAVRPLMNALNDGAALARENACIGLGILKDPRAIDILIHALQDEDSGVRYEASRALAKIGEPAVEPLIAALKSENENARMGAAKALGAIKNPRAVNPLTDLLKDNKRRVKREAMRALGKLQSAEAVKPLAEIALRQEGRDAVRAVSALSKIGYPALPQLISIYKKFPRLREKTGDYLTEIIDLSIDSLVSALHDKDPEIRIAIAKLFLKVEDEKHLAIPPLITALGDTNDAVRDSIAVVLVKFGKSAVPHLIASLKDTNTRAREAAVWILGKITDKRAVEPLCSILQTDPDTTVRFQSAAALRLIKDSSAVASLIRALKQDQNKHVRQQAAYALGAIKNPGAVSALIAALGDSYWNTRLLAAWALGEIADRRAVDALIAALKDGHKDVRYWAADGLGDIKNKRAVEELLFTLESDTVENVRKSALWALGEIKDRRAVQKIIEVLQNDQSAVMRIYAADALGKMDDKNAIIKPLITALKDDPDAGVRKQAVFALAGIKDNRAIKPLFNAFRDSDARVRDQAAGSIIKYKDEQVIILLIDGLKDNEINVRENSAWALGEIKDRRAVEPLIAALLDENKSIHNWISGALEKITGQKFGTDRHAWQQWWREKGGKNKK